MVKKKITQLNTILIFLMGGIFYFQGISGCAKKRIAHLPEETEETTIEKSLLTSSRMQLQLSPHEDAFKKKLLNLPRDTDLYFIHSVEGPESLKPIFNNFNVRSKSIDVFPPLPPSSDVSKALVSVVFEITKKYVTAYKEVDITEGQDPLTLFEKVVVVTAKPGARVEMPKSVRVAIFRFPIKAMGVLVPTKNDLQEETSTLRLKETNLESATHLQILFAESAREELQPLVTEGQAEELHLKSHFSEKEFLVTLDSEGDGDGSSDSSISLPLAAEEFKSYPIASMSGPPELKILFSHLSIRSRGPKTIRILMSVNKKYVTAYKVTPQESVPQELSILEQQIGLPKGNQVHVPLFSYELAGMGSLVPIKNEQNESTHLLRLKSTDLKEATFLQFNASEKSRIEVQLPTQLSQEIYLTQHIHKKSIEISNLRERLHLPALPDLMPREELDIQGRVVRKVPPGKKLFTWINGHLLEFYEITEIQFLKKSEREALQGNSAKDGLSVIPCEQVGKLEDELKDKNCVLVKVATTKIQQPKVQTVIEDSVLTPKLEIKENTSLDRKLVHIPHKNPVNIVTLHLPSGDDTAVSRLKNQEFLLRRTLQDGPNSFDYVFPGASGDLEIVNFVFTKDSVHIVRADALFRSRGSNALDREHLMSLPAIYLRKVFKDESGNDLDFPELVRTSFDDPEAIVRVDWKANSVQNTQSPISYYSLEQCFDGTSSKEILDMDNRLHEGILNFSLKQTYQASRNNDCVGIYQAGYFDRPQSSFTFQERISLMAYRENRKEPLLSVPFQAQKQLGYGLFTYKKKTPNQHGNTGTIGTEVALPAIFDLQKGKKVTYLLAGLPENPRLRASVIQATQEVIDDWNRAFQKAFHGTAMERPEPVLELKVVGRDISEDASGRLGDLDRNYIYYIQKKTESTVIGLGGSHPNPRNGRVEAASVFLYGGNIQSYIERLKKNQLAREMYRAMMSTTIPVPQSPSQPTDAGASPTSSPPGESGPVGGSPASGSEPPVVQPPVGDLPPTSANFAAHSTRRNSNSTKKPGSNIWKPHNFALHQQIQESLIGISQQPLFSNISINPKSLRLEGVKDSPLFHNDSPTLGAVNLARGLGPQQKALQEAIEASLESGSLADAGRFETVLLEKQVKHFGSLLSKSQMAQFKAEVRRKKAVAELMSALEKQRICIFQASEFSELPILGEGSENLNPEEKDLALFVAIYKPTLAHEIGHNLGLRHNFISSFDRDNWKFDESDGSRRSYSSIMDYLDDDHDTYDGLGPQDVASIRFAYAGMLELSPDIRGEIKAEDGKKFISPRGKKDKIEVFEDRYVMTLDYLKILEVPPETLSTEDVSLLPVKKFLFCSDEDAGLSPVCNRHDKGATPFEIVDNIANRYFEMYSVRNFPNDRLKFEMSDSAEHFGRLLGTLIPARQFLEETIYRVILGEPVENVSQFLQGAIRAAELFHEIIRTPDAPIIARDTDRIRFLLTPLEFSVPIETKWLMDSQVDDVSGRLRVRGIEFDKVISLHLLTQRNMGFQRYESKNLRISFPVLEKLLGIYRGEKTESESISSLELLRQILTDSVVPAGHSPFSMSSILFLTDGSYRASVSEWMRIVALESAVLSLDVMGFEASDNFSTLFRVHSAYEAPSGNQTVIEPGIGSRPGNHLVYWSPEDALSSKAMIEKMVSLGKIISARQDVQSLIINRWFATTLALEKAESEEKKTELQAHLLELNPDVESFLQSLPKGSGPVSVEELKRFFGLIRRTLGTLKVAESEMSRKDYLLFLDTITTGMHALHRRQPLAGVIIEGLLAENSLPEVKAAFHENLEVLTPEETLESMRSGHFRSVQTLNQILYLVHPELKR